MPNPIITALAGRVRTAGSAPLLTWYRPADGTRTELSAKTFANWVDKTANLLVTLDVEGPVAGRVNTQYPGHWMSLIWPLAAWQHGSGFLVGVAYDAADLVVVGPDAASPEPGRTVVACSLHPLGLGLRGLPDGVLDFSSEALAEPDVHHAEPAAPSAVAWQDAELSLTHAGLGEIPGVAERVLVRPASPWQALRDAVIAPLLGGGSAVVIEGEPDADTLARIAAAERVNRVLA